MQLYVIVIATWPTKERILLVLTARYSHSVGTALWEGVVLRRREERLIGREGGGTIRGLC
jgi:hypothetical protein